MREETMLSEQEILDRAIEGDAGAFEQIVNKHQGMVFSLAYHFLHDRGLAEELAQEVFLSLFRNLSSIKSPSHLVFWLRKVAGHRCLDQARRQRLRPQVPMDQVAEPSFEMTFRDVSMSRALENALVSLPEKQRVVLILRYQEDLEPLEIARTLDMPVNTVKSHLRRSLIALREKLTSPAEKQYGRPGTRTKSRLKAEGTVSGFYGASARARAGEF
ncbi:MAG TPA: RNA polymerase sigma factor [Blastocatellia bacterium]